MKNKKREEELPFSRRRGRLDDYASIAAQKAKTRRPPSPSESKSKTVAPKESNSTQKTEKKPKKETVSSTNNIKKEDKNNKEAPKEESEMKLEVLPKKQLKVSAFDLERFKIFKEIKNIQYYNEAFKELLDLLEEGALSEGEQELYDIQLELQRKKYEMNGWDTQLDE